jgi:hypothetical protein
MWYSWGYVKFNFKKYTKMKNKDCFFFLKDGEKYYVSEGKATFSSKNATVFSSPEQMVKTVPVMKDWNWDYALFKNDSGKIEKVPDHIWMTIHSEWKAANPEEYNQLYNSGNSNFVRVTN